MTPQLTEAFKKSLKSNRWNAIDLGAAANYTNDNMVARWITEKNQWLQVSLLFDSNVLVFRLVQLLEVLLANQMSEVTFRVAQSLRVSLMQQEWL